MVDPLADKWSNYSIYCYAINNSIIFIDPDGRDLVYYDTKGKEINRVVNDKVQESYILQPPPEGTACVSFSFKKATISMMYSGKMSEDNNKKSEGTLSINATYEDGTVQTLDTYSVNSGPTLVGTIPDGDYQTEKDPNSNKVVANTSEKGMVRYGVGFKVKITDNTENCRDRLFIHPDGLEAPGTAGCIGLAETKERLLDFKSKMLSIEKDGTLIKLKVTITSNPNPSDCDSKGKKKSSSKPAGN